MSMISDDSYEPPFQTDLDSDQDAALAGAAGDAIDSNLDAHEPIDPQIVALAEPFVGQWNGLISTTNWEKGRIISQWRAASIQAGSPANEHSDDAWARRVGGVTAPHVGRLRRVYDRFAETFESYDDLYWSHFLAAMEWEDAPLWLEGAARQRWSVSQMREQRWQAHGAVESQRPTASQVIEVDTDEDIVLPAQGGGKTREYGDEPHGVATGPNYEPPDFGDAEELASSGGRRDDAASRQEPSDEFATPVQPFAGLPELPDDLADAIEQLKLAVLRHKTSEWKDVSAETIDGYLNAVSTLVRS